MFTYHTHFRVTPLIHRAIKQSHYHNCLPLQRIICRIMRVYNYILLFMFPSLLQDCGILWDRLYNLDSRLYNS